MANACPSANCTGTGWLLAALLAALAFSTTMLWLVDRPMTRLRNRIRQVAPA